MGVMAGQRSFDDLGTPLFEVTFCVLDLETTGGAPGRDAITEIGAARFRGGECLGTFATLVNPGRAIPPSITVLTGITDAMVVPAPRLHQVLPALLEFVGDAVIVGHNVRFDLGFLAAALEADGRPPLTNRWVDTCALARRLVADEVPNCKLATLATRLRLDHRPTHRALDDVLATADLLHLLLERVGNRGISGLDDLLALPKLGGHPQFAKLRLTDGLPRRPGVYLFGDRGGRVLYVGKATDLRTRVRSYFSGDSRRKVPQLLRETATIDHQVHPHPLSAAVAELRLIHQHLPRFNRQGTRAASSVHLVLRVEGGTARLALTRSRPGDGSLTLGPLPSTSAARRTADAVAGVVARHRAADVSPVDLVARGLTTDPALLLDPLATRMRRLADAERFEEATKVRDQGVALVSTLRRQRRLDAMVASGELHLRFPDGGGAVVVRGLLARAWGPDAVPVELVPPPEGDDRLAAARRAEERLCIASWLDSSGPRVRIESCSGVLATPAVRLPCFEPAPATHGGGRRLSRHG